MKLSKVLAAALLTTTLAGCYVHTPIHTGQPPAPGQEVRIRYDDATLTQRLPWQRGLFASSSAVTGTVLEWGRDSVTLAVFPPPTQGMSRASPHPDTVNVPVQGIAFIEQRELSWGRTAAFGVGAGVVGAFLVRALFNWTRRAPDPVGQGG